MVVVEIVAGALLFLWKFGVERPYRLRKSWSLRVFRGEEMVGILCFFGDYH